MRPTSSSSLLKEIASQKECPPCVAIIAPDRTRRERALAYLVGSFCPKGYQPLSFTFADGRHALATFLGSLAEPSLFEPQKFAVIKGIETAKAADLEPLSKFLASLTPATGIHVFVMGSSLPNSPNFKKNLAQHAKVLDLEALKGAELRRWTERELKNAGVAGITDEIVETILSAASEEPDAAAAIIEKIALYLDGAPASLPAIKELIPGRSTASDFELAEQLLIGKRGASEVLLNKLVLQGSSPFMLIGLLSKTFSSLVRIRALLDKGLSSQQIKEDLGITPWLMNKYLPLAKRFSLPTLSAHLAALLKADFRLKDRSISPAAVFGMLARDTSQERAHGH